MIKQIRQLKELISRNFLHFTLIWKYFVKLPRNFFRQIILEWKFFSKCWFDGIFPYISVISTDSVCHALFWLKIRENDIFTKEIPKKLIWRIIFSVRGNFSISVDFTDVINFFFVIQRRPNPTTCFTSLHSVLDHLTSISRKFTGFFGYFKASFFWKNHLY